MIPEPWTGPTNARQKDDVENSLHSQVCSGALRLAEAQQWIATDWQAANRVGYRTIATTGLTSGWFLVDD